MSSIEYLDDERKKLWDNILKLEKNLESRLPDDEKEAKQSSRKISEYKNKSIKSKELIDAILEKSQVAAAKTQADLDIAKENLDYTMNVSANAEFYSNKMEDLKTGVRAKLNRVKPHQLYSDPNFA